jgi:hypothetical protein
MEQCFCGKYYTDKKGGFVKHTKSKQHNEYVEYELEKIRTEEQRLDDEAYDNYIAGEDFDIDRVNRIVYG